MRIPGLGSPSASRRDVSKAAPLHASASSASELLDQLAQQDAVRLAARRFPPAAPDQVRTAEASLGFPLPDLLCRVYTAIANGGFGPGRGLLGLPGGATDKHGSSIVDLYDSFSASSADDPAWRWPDRLVPLCAWAPSVYTCVDCADPEGAVVGLDLIGYEPGRSLKEFLLPQAPMTLEAWLRAWVEGADLWSQMFPLLTCLGGPSEESDCSK